MKKVLVPLAPGCEELEAVTVIDLLTRAGVDVTTAGLSAGTVLASRGVEFVPKKTIDEVLSEDFDMVVLPGGLPGADHLRDNESLQRILKTHSENGHFIAAICAAPKALVAAGVVKNKNITCYPGALDEVDLSGIELTGNAVEIDGKVITSRGPGTAMDFALSLVELLEGKEKRIEVEKGLSR